MQNCILGGIQTLSLKLSSAQQQLTELGAVRPELPVVGSRVRNLHAR
jgi:hypothetical protein